MSAIDISAIDINASTQNINRFQYIYIRCFHLENSYKPKDMHGTLIFIDWNQNRIGLH